MCEFFSLRCFLTRINCSSAKPADLANFIVLPWSRSVSYGLHRYIRAYLCDLFSNNGITENIPRSMDLTFFIEMDDDEEGDLQIRL